MVRSIDWVQVPRTAVLGVALFAAVPLPAQRTETKLRSTDGVSGDRFGTAVAVQGNLLVSGAFLDDGQSGSAYVFERSGSAWQQTAKLVAADRAASDEFGFAVAIGDRDTVFVGSRRSDAAGFDAGAVYVFSRTATGWAQSARIIAGDAESTSLFGSAVSSDGVTLAVGAFAARGQTGAAYLFERGTAGWTQVAKLVASDATAGDTFGAGIAVGSGGVIVGAPGEGDQLVGSGAAYVFERTTSGWLQVARLKPADLGAGDGFGLNVDVDGGTAVAGARFNRNLGAAYVFERGTSGWAQTAKLVSSDVEGGDLFGHDVAVRGDQLLASARNKANMAGAAYVFRRAAAGWSQTEKLVASDAGQGDNFGQNVGLDGRLAVVGSWGDESQTGAVYVLEAPSRVDPVRSTITATPALVPAYGGYVATLVVDPRDANGERIMDALPVVLSTTAGSLLGSVARVGDGTWSQQLAPDPAAAGAVVSAVVDGKALVATATVRFLAADLAISTLEVAPETIYVGESASITLNVRDDQGRSIGHGGLQVVFATSSGTLLGSVQDLGDGRYTQQIRGDVAATVGILATVDGLAIVDGAALLVQEPQIITTVTGERLDGTLLPYATIQRAVRSAASDGLRRILVPPGDYDEVVRVDQARGLSIEGLVRFGRVAVRGFVIVGGMDVTIDGFEVDASDTQHAGVRVLQSQGVVLRNLFVHGGARSGIVLDAGNCGVLVADCRVEGCAMHGVDVLWSQGIELRRCVVVANGHCGVVLEPRAVVLIADSTITGNGLAGDDRQGYGILRERPRASPDARDVTLLRNVVGDNHGRVVAGRSTADFGNWDAMIDGGDVQSPF